MGDGGGQQEYAGYPGWGGQAGWNQGGYQQYPGYAETPAAWTQPAYQPPADQVACPLNCHLKKVCSAAWDRASNQSAF